MRAREELIERARAQIDTDWGLAYEIEVDEDAIISEGDGGAFVSAWVWVAEDEEDEE